MAAKSPYLGSRINLISKSEIRYEGTLFGVDSQASTISLSKVRSFGTEDRPTSRPVKAREEVFEYVIFKATDIKDLVVMEDVKPSELTCFDPAIVSLAKSPRPAPQQQNHYFNHSNQFRRGPPQHFQQSGSYIHSYGPKRHHNNEFYVPHKDKLKFDSDYDFAKANEQFEKAVTEVAKDATTPEEDVDGSEEKTDAQSVENKESNDYYNKQNSFFDEISCEALEKADGKYNRPNWRKERQTNQETFGPMAMRNQGQYQRRPQQFNRFRPSRVFNPNMNRGPFRPKSRPNNYVRV